MWLWPLYLVLVVTTLALTEKVPGAGVPVPIISGTIFLIITVGTLALSYRKYLDRLADARIGGES